MIPRVNKPLSIEEVKKIAPIVLAFIGDGVQTLYVRTRVALEMSRKTGELHNIVSREVRATFQSQIVDAIYHELTDEEQEVLKKGRNSYTASKAKNSTANEYHKASGLESLIGYLYLLDRYDRLLYILNIKTV